MIRYAITDPLYYGSDILTLSKRTAEAIRRGPVDWFCLRDKNNPRYAALAEAFLELSSSYPQTKFLLHGDVQLARRLGAWGVHLPSNALEDISVAKARGLFVIASTHSLKEALVAQSEGADAVTFSPVFHSPGKGLPQGLEKLKEIRDKISIKLIALGGIVTDVQIEAVEKIGADGFASIRHFVNKEQEA